MTRHFAKYFELPVDGPEHTVFRKDLWVGGTDYVCRYYLSMLTNRDCFPLPLDELLCEIRQFVVDNVSPNAAVFFDEPGYTSLFARPVFEHLFDSKFGLERKVGKEDRGLILLLKHPDWSDERIRAALKTTMKQMSRWSNFRLARIVQRRYASQRET